MIPIIGQTQSFTLPDRVREGQRLSAAEADALMRLFVSRMRTLVTHWLERKNMSPAEAQAHLALEAERFTFADDLTSAPLDPISAEALRLARGIVRKKVAEAGLELTDESLTRHASEVAKLDSVRKMAEDIVTTRRAKALEALNAGVSK